MQISACQELPLELEGQKSVLALNLEIEDNKGSLRAFETPIELKNGKQGTAVCFQHNVPMGSSEHADDSPMSVMLAYFISAKGSLCLVFAVSRISG